MKVNWVKAKIDYIKDDALTLANIAQRHKVSETSVYERASKERWVELRQETLVKAEEKLREKLPETIAQTNLRHAGIGKALQGIGLDAIKKGMCPQSYKDARLSIISGVGIEREALGLSEKEVKDEVYQKFQQFSFIFTLSDDELQRFIKSALGKGEGEPVRDGESPAKDGEIVE